FKPIFRGRSGTYGQQLRGGQGADSPVAIYSFHHVGMSADDKGNASFEMKVGIEKGGSEDASDEDVTRVEVAAVNPATMQVTSSTTILPETHRTSYFQLPASALNGGDFDLVLRNQTSGHWVGLKQASLGLMEG